MINGIIGMKFNIFGSIKNTLTGAKDVKGNTTIGTSNNSTAVDGLVFQGCKLIQKNIKFLQFWVRLATIGATSKRALEIPAKLLTPVVIQFFELIRKAPIKLALRFSSYFGSSIQHFVTKLEGCTEPIQNTVVNVTITQFISCGNKILPNIVEFLSGTLEDTKTLSDGFCNSYEKTPPTSSYIAMGAKAFKIVVAKENHIPSTAIKAVFSLSSAIKYLPQYSMCLVKGTVKETYKQLRTQGRTLAFCLVPIG